MSGVKNKEDLFFHITGLDPLTHNATNLERIHMKGQPAHIVSAIDDDTPEHFKPMEYPFDYAWKKVEQYKKSKKAHQSVSNKCKTDAVKIPGEIVVTEGKVTV